MKYTSVVTPETRMAHERACERLVAEYCHRVDLGEAARAAELFTDDAVWESTGVRLQGREQIDMGFAFRQSQTTRRSRHVCTNVVIDVRDEDHAEGLTYLTLFRSDDAGEGAATIEGPHLVGEYRDVFVRQQGTWMFCQRTLHVAFMRKGASVL